MEPPCGNIEEEAARGEVGPVAIVDGGAEAVAEPQDAARQVAPRKRHVALRRVPGVVHRDEAADVARARPREGQEVVVRRVPVPRRPALEELPAPEAERGVPQAAEEVLVEVGDLGVPWLRGPAPEVDRDPDPLPLPLPLVNEAKARGEVRDDGGGPVDVRGEGRGRARLVVVFQEARQVILEIQSCQQVIVCRANSIWVETLILASHS